MPMFIPLALAAVGTGVSVAGAMGGVAAQKKAEDAQRRMNDLRAARDRTLQMRDARAKAADIQQRGVNQGAGASSSVTTGASGAFDQAYSNIQYIGYEQQTGDAISHAKQQEADAQGVAEMGKGIVDIGGAAAGNAKLLGLA